MNEGQPSRTALRVAMRRAAHQLLDDPKVFIDPIALPILGAELAASIKADPKQLDASPLDRTLRAFMAARSRYTEDELDLAIDRGVSQYVILGAGLDTFAYRNPYSADKLRVFEVDFPATQEWKRERLKQAGIPIPADLIFAAVDFETQTLMEGLVNAGYDPAKSTFFSWLGVTPYLALETVMATLKMVSSGPKENAIVFDYGITQELMTPEQGKIFDILAGRVASAGEPWRTLFDPEKLVADLKELGFTTINDVGPVEINAKYFNDRKDELRVGGVGRIMSARV